MTYPGIGWSCATGTARPPFRQLALHITALGWGIKDANIAEPFVFPGHGFFALASSSASSFLKSSRPRSGSMSGSFSSSG